MDLDGDFMKMEHYNMKVISKPMNMMVLENFFKLMEQLVLTEFGNTVTHIVEHFIILKTVLFITLKLLMVTIIQKLS